LKIFIFFLKETIFDFVGYWGENYYVQREIVEEIKGIAKTAE
jgi:hypothetical protein